MISFSQKNQRISVDKLSEQALLVSMRDHKLGRVCVRVTLRNSGEWTVRPDGTWEPRIWSYIGNWLLVGDLMFLMAVFGLEIGIRAGRVHTVWMEKRYRHLLAVAPNIAYNNLIPATSSGWTYFGVRTKTFNKGIFQLGEYIVKLAGVIGDDKIG